MSLLIFETSHQLKLFWRRPAAILFVMVLPLILLVLFTELFGNEVVEEHNVTTSQFYAPSLAVFGVVTACYAYLAVSTATARDLGVLKRIRGTPMPPSTYLAARIFAVSLIAFAAALIVVGAGVLFYGIKIYWLKAPAGLLVLAVGSATFSALGMLVVALCRSADTTQAAINATLLPLAFVSDIFIRPFREVPAWLKWIGDIFPLKHFANGFGGAFRPDLAGNGLVWQGGENTYAMLPDLAVLALWGAGAAFLASRYFRWEPR